MTPDEYARKIASDLGGARQTLSQNAVPQIFERADKALVDASFTTTEQRQFWGNVRSYLGADLLVEKQANSALLALMQAIQRNLAAREQKQ
jgi:hypothetical protein